MSKNFLYASSSLALAGTMLGALLTPAFAHALSNNEIPEAVAGSCCSDIIGNNTGASAIRIGVPQKLTLGIKGSYNF